MAEGTEELIDIARWPEGLRHPVLILVMEGWIDAGLGAAGALSTLLQGMPTEIFATFDSDALIDQRARRPMLRIVSGVNTSLNWPELTLRLGENEGRSVIVMSGPEPDMRWKQFTREVVSVTRRLGVEMVVGLGAFPAPVPHTRPVRMVATATTQELADRIGYLPATIEVPAGIQASLERAFAEANMPAVGIWARVPHYAAGMPYPAASDALLNKLHELTGVVVDTTELKSTATNALGQLDQLISGSPEHSAMVRQLERQEDDEAIANAGGDFNLSNLTTLPSGDEIAAELERFLRGDDQQ